MYFSKGLLKHTFFLDKLWPLFLSNRIILILRANYKCSQLWLTDRIFAFRSFCTNLAFAFIPTPLPTPTLAPHPTPIPLLLSPLCIFTLSGTG